MEQKEKQLQEAAENFLINALKGKVRGNVKVNDCSALLIKAMIDFNQSEAAKAYWSNTFELGENKPFIVANVRELLNQMNKGEISFSKMVELMNEMSKAYWGKTEIISYEEAKLLKSMGYNKPCSQRYWVGFEGDHHYQENCVENDYNNYDDISTTYYSATTKKEFNSYIISEIFRLKKDNEGLKKALDKTNIGAFKEIQSQDKEIDDLKKELELKDSKLKELLPDDCINGYGEVKFCYIRNSYGNECKKCIN